MADQPTPLPAGADVAGAEPSAPLVISFYCGADYYYRAAQALREDCVRLGLDHHIVEAPLPRSIPWLQACRYKVRFIEECLRRFDRPLLWMDADCRLLDRPTLIDSCRADLGFFLRGFRYLKDYDPVALPRLAQPSILYFNNSPAVRDFVALMASLETGHAGEATDDYFLQEAWLRFDRPLSLLLLPPDLVCFELPAKGRECFFFGRSGNAAAFKDSADQHAVPLHDPARRKAVLLREAGELVKSGRLVAARSLLRRAHEIDPTDEALAYRIARLLKRAGKAKQARGFLRRFRGPDLTVDHATRFALSSALDEARLDRAEALVQRLLASGSPADVAWARSRQLRLGLEQRAKALGLAVRDRPALWWMEGPYPGNLGDILNPYVVEKLSGLPPRLAPRGRGILAIGSTIKFATRETVVWGTGTPRMTDRLDPQATYLAVRGPLTRQLVLESGGSCPEVYGDPSWFLPRLYRPTGVTRRYRLGLVLHHAHAGELAAGEGVKPISVLRGSYEDIERFVDELHECECILSSSLHGLILAHAYGIPARWCDVQGSAGGPPGDGTKFRDYLLSVGLEPGEPLQIERGGEVTADHARTPVDLPARPIDLDALTACAPFQLASR